MPGIKGIKGMYIKCILKNNFEGLVEGRQRRTYCKEEVWDQSGCGL